MIDTQQEAPFLHQFGDELAIIGNKTLKGETSLSCHMLVSNTLHSCTCAHVCTCMLEFVCFLVDYSLALGSAYLADLLHSLGLVLVLYITHSLVVRFVLVLQYSSCFFCTVQFSLVM